MVHNDERSTTHHLSAVFGGPRQPWYSKNVMSIPNVKRYKITSPDGSMTASLMAVLPKDIDVTKYLSEASQRFDWKAYQEAQAKQFKIRVGQQKQKKAK
jgi:hypothetical protein